MLTLAPFPWRRLTERSELAHRLDERGELLLHGGAAEEPFRTVRVRDGGGGFVGRELGELGFVWTPAWSGEGWTLRTGGEPATMTRAERVWGELVRAVCDPLGLDERLVLTTVACESGGAAPDASGFVRAPRTEKGYPRRTGETDPGDFERDAEDWASSRGAHSSHGLMQTLIGTAVAARPDLFRHLEPSRYRTVLWVPAHSVACGAAYLAGFPREVLADPLAVRFHYGAGRVRPAANRWGAVLYDELVPLSWVALWNDDAAVRRTRGAEQRAPDAVAQRGRVGPAASVWAALTPPSGAGACTSCASSPVSTTMGPTGGLALLLSAGVLLFGSVLAKGAHR